MNLLKLFGVNKTYYSETKEKVEAIVDFSYVFPNKGLVFVIGESGSGKSTLLNLIGGLDKDFSGSIIVNDENLNNFKNSKKDAYRNSCISFVFQDYNLLEDYTVGKNIGIALELQGKLSLDQIHEVLKQVELEGFYHRYPDELSGGERQRVAIARALAKKSNIILADEPAASLDEVTREEIYRLFKKISKEKLVIIASHDLDNALKMGDQIIRMHQGELLDTQIISEYQSLEDIKINYLKPKLSFKNILLSARKIFSGKPIRMFFNIILFSLVLSVFGFFISVLFLDKEEIIFNAVIDHKIKDIVISKYAPKRDNYINLSLEDVKTIKGIVQEDWYYVYDVENLGFDGNFVNDPDRRFTYYYTLQRFGGVMGLNKEIAEELNFVLKAGNYPEKRSDGFEEIVISEYIFELFEYWGFDKYSLEGGVEIEEYSDMIGRKLSIRNGNKRQTFYISGIIDTNSNIDKFSYLKAVSKTNYEFRFYLGSSPDMFLYTRTDYPLDFEIKYLYTAIDNLSKQDLKTLLDLHYSDSYLKTYNYLINEIDSTEYSLLIHKNIFILSIIIISIFSILVLINHIKYTLTLNHKHFGILRSLGLSRANLFSIYLFSGLLIIIFTLGISIFGLSLINNLVNNIMLKDNIILKRIFKITFKSIILMLIFNIIANLFAIALPVCRKFKKNNIEIIKRKE